ncbi:MAG: nucleotidyltransferase domain-containing protein [Nanoarchaeota archaeon]
MKPIEKIYFAFFKAKKNQLYFNELKKISGLKDSSLNKNLKELVDKKEIKKEKEKSNTYYSLKNKQLKSVYFAKFAIEKFQNLNYKVKIPLQDFLKEINNIKYIIHFGSSSRAEEKEDSDIDLLVVLNSFENDDLNKLYQKEITQNIEEIKQKTNVTSIYPISCFYIDEQNFINVKEDYVVLSAKETGYPIYNQAEYYLKNEY